MAVAGFAKTEVSIEVVGKNTFAVKA